MIYPSEDRLRAYQLRSAIFDVRRRGLDPKQVHEYLSRIADEIDRLHRDLTTANTEAERIRQALRQWQSRHTDCCHHTDAPNATDAPRATDAPHATDATHARRMGNTSTYRAPGTANSG